MIRGAAETPDPTERRPPGVGLAEDGRKSPLVRIIWWNIAIAGSHGVLCSVSRLM
jgi:hypothetical protein